MQALVESLKLESLLNEVGNFEKQFSFSDEEWFAELTNNEIVFYDDYLDLYEKNQTLFLEVLASRKKQKLRYKKIKSVKNVKANLKDKRERVQYFFGRISTMQLIRDVTIMSQILPYIVEKNIAEYVIGMKGEDEEWFPYNLEYLRDDKLAITFEDTDIHISVQAIFLFLFMNEMLHELDEVRLVNCECKYPEALFAFNYAEALQKDSLIQFFILKGDTQITSLMFANLVFSKATRFLLDALKIEELADNDAFVSEVFEQIEILSNRKVIEQYECYKNYLNNKITKLEERETTHIKKQMELQAKLDRQKEQLEQQTEKAKQLKQELHTKGATVVQSATADKQLKEEIKRLRIKLKAEKDELKESTKEHQRVQKSLEQKLSTIEEENKRLTSDVSLLQSQLTMVKRQKMHVQDLTFEVWLAKGPQFLVDMTEEQESKLKDFITIAQNIVEDSITARPKVNLATNRIGYVRIEPDRYYITFGDDTWHVLEPFAAPVYLSDNQFVEVTDDLQFVRSFKYFFESGPADFAITQFVVVENRHDKAFAKVNGQTIEIKYKEKAFIMDGQVISINRNNELVSYYKNRSITLDDLYNAVQQKGHKPLYVLAELTNGYVVRTLHGIESFAQYSEQLTAHSFIIVDEQNNVTYVDPTGALLKRSSKYKEKLLASVSEIDDEIFVLKVNEEYVKLHDVPDRIELDLGDMVWVDEFNCFIEKVKEEVEIVSSETIEQKLMSSGQKVTRKTERVQIEKDKDLLIIGNVRISERYKKYFGEFGYNVEVVDGTGPFEKISKACSKHNTILYSTAFTSHKNSGKLLKEIKKPFILCDSTAPRVLHYSLGVVQ